MIVKTEVETIVKGPGKFIICDAVGNELTVVTTGLLFDALTREELLLQFVEVQMAIGKTHVHSTKVMLKKYRAELLAQIQGNYAHL